MKKTINIVVILMVVFMLAVTACANQQTATQAVAPTVVASNAVIAEGHLRPVQAADLSFQTRGVVEEIHVKIGDNVRKGDVLARLANAPQAEGQLSAANLELVDAQQAIDSLNRTGSANLATAWSAYMDAQEVRAEAERDWESLNVDDIDERIEDAKAEVQDREADLQDAQVEFDKYQYLDKDNSKRKTAEDDLEIAQEDYNEAVRKLEETTRERDIIRAALDSAIATDGVNADQLALAQARLENAKAQVAAAQATLSNYLLIAPFDGVTAEVAIEIGEQVSAESRAVSVADTSAWIIETTDVTELEVVKITEGQAVTFTADALSDVTMNGVVTGISQSSFLQGGDVIYTVRIQAQDVDPRVKWGMTVEVTFEPLETN